MTHLSDSGILAIRSTFGMGLNNSPDTAAIYNTFKKNNENNNKIKQNPFNQASSSVVIGL
jgi:hypothetical protein